MKSKNFDYSLAKYFIFVYPAALPQGAKNEDSLGTPTPHFAGQGGYFFG